MANSPLVLTARVPAFASAVLLVLGCLLAPGQNAPGAAAQTAATASLNDALMTKATTLYNSTTRAGLHGFDCQLHPDWNTIMTSSRKGAAVAADDPRLALLNEVKLTLHARLDGNSSLDWQQPATTDKPLDPPAISMLDKAHRGIEQTLMGVLKMWIPLVDGSIAETLGEDDMQITETENGYSLRSKDKQHSVTEEFDRGLLLKRFVAADSGSTIDIAPNYEPTGQGLLLKTLAAKIQPAAASAQSAQEMHVGFVYQTVAGAKIPSAISIDVLNVVQMDFTLDGCTVNPASK